MRVNVGKKKTSASLLSHLQDDLNDVRRKRRKVKGGETEEKEEMMRKENSIVDQIGEEISKRHRDKVFSIIDTVSNEYGTMNQLSVWDLKKKLIPSKTAAVPIGKTDSKRNLVTDQDGLKRLYLQTYVHRLRNRPIKPRLKKILHMRMKLFQSRLQLSKSRISREWTMIDLNSVLSDLKLKKCRDPSGLLNKLFKSDVAGSDFKTALLCLFNGIKRELKIPQFIQLADVSSFYKGKGKKCDLSNERGIFIVSIFRYIMMRLMYRDKYDIIDANMSDSNIGARDLRFEIFLRFQIFWRLF